MRNQATFTRDEIVRVLRRNLERWRYMRTSDKAKSDHAVAAYQEVAIQLLGEPVEVESTTLTTKRDKR